MTSGTSIAIIGCGNMGSALAERLSKENSLFLYDHHFEKTLQLQTAGYGKACKDLKEAISQAEILILAVKPVSFNHVAESVLKCGPINSLIISLLSGKTLLQLRESFPTQRLVRMMPNLAVLYGSGLMGLVTDKAMSESDLQLLDSLCSSLGKAYWLQEEQFNAFTSLAGSGPAFALAIFDSMVDAGIAMGLGSKTSQEIVQQMVLGSLDLWLKSGKHPGELKWQITSPGGTTIAGIRKMEETALRSAIIETFVATFKRANEMSK